jgi:hypothetical protein
MCTRHTQRSIAPGFIIIFLYPAFSIGDRLRQLLRDPALAQTPAHVHFVLRTAFGFLLPATVASVGMVFVNTGQSAPVALATALPLAAAAMYVGFSPKLPACSALGAAIAISFFVIETAGFVSLICAGLGCIVTIITLVASWRHVSRHPWSDLDQPNQVVTRILEGISEMDRASTAALPIRPGTAWRRVFRIGWSGPSAGWMVRGLSCAGMAFLGWMATYRAGPDHAVAPLLGLLSLFTILASANWSYGGRTQFGSDQPSPQALLSSHRLHPWSHSRSAVATLLTIWLHTMNVAVPAALGACLGAAAGVWHHGGATTTWLVLLLLVPFSAACSAATAAAHVLQLTLGGAGVAVHVLVIIALFITPLVGVLSHPHLAWLPAPILALVLVPWALRRLRMAELP